MWPQQGETHYFYKDVAQARGNEEIDDQLATFSNIWISSICLIFKNENTDSFLFSPKDQLFSFFEKSELFSTKLIDFGETPPLGGFGFLNKKHNFLFRDGIGRQNPEISMKIKQIHMF